MDATKARAAEGERVEDGQSFYPTDQAVTSCVTCSQAGTLRSGDRIRDVDDLQRLTIYSVAPTSSYQGLNGISIQSCLLL